MDNNKQGKTIARSGWYVALTILMCFIFLPLGIFMLFCIYYGGADSNESPETTSRTVKSDNILKPEWRDVSDKR